MSIKVSISVGELLDKLTILQIKMERIDDPAKRANVAREMAELEAIWNATDHARHGTLDEAIGRLRTANEQLWQIEDAIREQEARQEFGPRFIELARAVYFTNDRRSEIKREINRQTGSELVEEKSYSAY